jgi:hypothetical protein
MSVPDVAQKICRIYIVAAGVNASVKSRVSSAPLPGLHLGLFV